MLSLSQLHSHPRFVFVSEFCVGLCLCVAVAVVCVSTCIECMCLLCAARVGREKGTTNLKDVTCSTASKIYTRDSPVSLLAVIPFPGEGLWEGRSGRVPNKHTLEGTMQAKKKQNKTRTDAIAWTDVWREVCKHSSGGNSRLFTAIMLEIGKRSRDAWQVH